MNTLISILSDSIGIVIGAIIFCLLSYIVETSDPESGLHKFKKEEIFFYYILLVLSSLIVNLRFTNMLDRGFFMALLGILLFHAHTDSKTNEVYRIFSLFLWGLGIIYTILKLFVVKCIVLEPAYIGMFLIGPAVFIVVMFLTSVLSGWLHGKGDGYILIGNAFFIQFLAVGPGLFTIEPILIHYILAAVILILMNPKKISFRKARMKERVAYAPAVFGATLLTILFTAFLI